MELVSIFRGVTTPIRVLIEQMEQQGWELQNLAWSSDRYVAKGRSTHGETLERFGPDERTAVANLLMAVTRRNHMRTPAQAKVGAWGASWTDKLKEIADGYAALPVYDPKAAGAWKELAEDSVRRMAILGQQLDIEVTPNPEPYNSQQEMCDDIHQNKHFYVSSANTEHPVWTTDQNVAFRVVHDVMGHCVSGGSFDWAGENLACGAHFPLLSPSAQQALFTECIGQTAYAAYYRNFGPQKVALMSEFLDPAQAEENPAAHQGIHPSQTIAPTTVPEYSETNYEGFGAQPKGTIAPHQEALGLTPVLTAAQVLDPNHAWQSGQEPHPEYHAVLHYGDPLDAAAVKDTAAKIDTGWSQRDPSNPGDRALMKQAIVNAFRTVLLSPRKDLRWNAIHYQDIAGVPADVSDPKVYWDTLEQKRQDWNGDQIRKLYDGKVSPETLEQMVEEARVSHQSWRKLWPNFFNVVYQQVGDYQEAQQKAERMVMEWQVQEHERLEMDEQGKDPQDQDSADALERKATKAMEKRMKSYIKDFQPALDFALAADQMGFDIEDPEQAPPEQVDRYGAFMGTHLKSIAQVSQYADHLLDAAIKDVQEHDGTGHHFRAETLRLGVPGVGPKVASFAWLLLQPLTSELGTIDTHMMDVLGRDYNKEMNNRDYFKFERELQAGRDAAGYQHVPLGQFQWGMWDHKRTGPGSHQDHSAMRVLDPLPHDQIDWAAKSQNLKGESWHDQAPEWWQATAPARQQVAEHFEQNVAPSVPVGTVPWTSVKSAPLTEVAKVAGRPNQGEVEWQPGDFGRAIYDHQTDQLHRWRVLYDEDNMDANDDQHHIGWARAHGINWDLTNDTGQPVAMFMKPDGSYSVADYYGKDWQQHQQRIEELMGGPPTNVSDDNMYDVMKGWTAKVSKGEPFSYYWNKEKPHKVSNAEKMAEYAAGDGKTSRSEAISFIESHRSDVDGVFSTFKKNFLKKFDRMKELHPHAKVAAPNVYLAIGPTSKYYMELHGAYCPSLKRGELADTMAGGSYQKLQAESAEQAKAFLLKQYNDQQMNVKDTDIHVHGCTKTRAASITSASTPWHLDQETQEHIRGEPGEPLMQHLKRNRGLSTQEIWNLDLPVGRDDNGSTP